MSRISKVQQAIKYFTNDGIVISSDKKYFPLSSVAAKYFNLSEEEFVTEYPGSATLVKSKKLIAPGKLLKCLDKTENGRAIIDKINGNIGEKIQKIIGETVIKSKELIKTVTVDNMVQEMSFREKNDEKSITYGTTTIEKITETDPDVFYGMTGCPKGTLAILKNLNVPVYKVSSVLEYVINYDDSEKIFGTCSAGDSRVYKTSDGSVFIYSIINEKHVNNVMNVTASNALSYSFQRQMIKMHPDRFLNVRDVPDPKKRTEYEALHYLYLKLSSDFIFKYQVKVGAYYIDCVIIPKGLNNKNMIDISIEIDENGHGDRDPVKEKQRENFVKAAGFEAYRIPIKNDLPSETIRKIIDEESDKIIKMIKKTFVFNSPDLVLKMIKEYVIENNVHNNFISLFFRETTPGNPFVYTHEDIGAYLGFSKEENYRGLTDLIKSCCTEYVDYTIIIKDGKYYYNVTRIGFNYICSTAKTELAAKISKVFARVYELVTQLTVMLASGVPDSMKLSAKDKSCAIECEILKHIEGKANSENQAISKLM